MLYTRHFLHHIRRTLGLNIYRLRVKKGLPLHRLATLTGISSQKIDSYEIGKNQLCFEHLVQIACALNVPIENLLRT